MTGLRETLHERIMLKAKHSPQNLRMFTQSGYVAHTCSDNAVCKIVALKRKKIMQTKKYGLSKSCRRQILAQRKMRIEMQSTELDLNQNVFHVAFHVARHST